MKKIFLFLFAVFFLFPSFSQYSPSKFSLIGVKVEDSSSNTDLHKITVFFNEEIDTSSVSESNIFVNDKPSKIKRIIFSKRGRSFSFYIKRTEEKFSLRFENIKSPDRQIISSIRLDDFEDNVFWRFSRELNAWQKY